MGRVSRGSSSQRLESRYQRSLASPGLWALLAGAFSERSRGLALDLEGIAGLGGVASELEVGGGGADLARCRPRIPDVCSDQCAARAGVRIR